MASPIGAGGLPADTCLADPLPLISSPEFKEAVTPAQSALWKASTLHLPLLPHKGATGPGAG